MTILIVDDHQIYIDSLRDLLDRLFPGSKIHEALNALYAFEILEEIIPDLILLDIKMPNVRGLEAAEIILKKYPQSKIVILTSGVGTAMALNLVRVGVQGFLFKEASALEIKDCIDNVVNGNVNFCKKVDGVIQKYSDKLDDLPAVQVSKLEKNILKLIELGRTTKEIAGILDLPECTINSYRKDLMRKTKTKSSSNLIAYAYSNFIIDGSDDLGLSNEDII